MTEKAKLLRPGSRIQWAGNFETVMDFDILRNPKHKGGWGQERIGFITEKEAKEYAKKNNIKLI